MVLPDNRGRPRRRRGGAKVRVSSSSKLTSPGTCAEFLVLVSLSNAFVLTLVIFVARNVHLHVSLHCSRRLCALGAFVPYGHFRFAHTPVILSQCTASATCLLHDRLFIVHETFRIRSDSSLLFSFVHS